MICFLGNNQKQNDQYTQARYNKANIKQKSAHTIFPNHSSLLTVPLSTWKKTEHANVRSQAEHFILIS